MFKVFFKHVWEDGREIPDLKKFDTEQEAREWIDTVPKIHEVARGEYHKRELRLVAP